MKFQVKLELCCNLQITVCTPNCYSLLQQGDDPPYLSVGTAVSAKYKGAFCEAKVSKVVRVVKCKVSCLVSTTNNCFVDLLFICSQGHIQNGPGSGNSQRRADQGTTAGWSNCSSQAS